MKQLDLFDEAETVQDRLVALGVPSSSARTYAYMLSMGPARASELAAAMGTSRDDVYRHGNELVRQGLASATLTRPLMYVPAGPGEVLRRLHQRSICQAESVRRMQAELEPLLREISCAADPAPRMPFRIINGRDRAYDNLREMLDGAMTEMLVLNTHPAAAELAQQAGLWHRIQQRADVGLRLRILVRDTPGTTRYAQQVSSPNCQVRVLQLEASVRFSVVDKQRMLFFASMDASPWMGANDCAVLTEMRGFIQSQTKLFGYLWGEAAPVDAKGP